MIIVIFHVLYLIGKLVYRSYQERESRYLPPETQEQQEAAASNENQNFVPDGNGNRDSGTKRMTPTLDSKDIQEPYRDRLDKQNSGTDSGPGCITGTNSGPGCITGTDSGPGCITSTDSDPCCNSDTDSGPGCITGIRSGPGATTGTGPRSGPIAPVRFFPPAYIQRYTTVQDVLQDRQFRGKLRKVVDFGCSELSFFVYLKNTEGVAEVFCVDINRPILELYKSKVEPLHTDYLHVRTSPLKVSVFEGSVTDRDNRLLNTDAVVCIELIEHLYPETEIEFPYNIFGFIQPKVAIVTTPNADFNVLFPNFNGFRHADHKFEWTREQFQDWANNITLRYPSYQVHFQGICYGPEGTEHLGPCTQMAVFSRTAPQDPPQQVQGRDDLLRTVTFVEYPSRVDSRSDEEKILDDVQYYIRLFSYGDDGVTQETVPLAKLLLALRKYYLDLDTLRDILRDDGWTVEHRDGEPVLLLPEPSTFSNDSERFREDDFLDDVCDDTWEPGFEPGPPEDTWGSSRDRTLASPEGPGDTTRFRRMAEDSHFFGECESWGLEDEPSLILPGEVALRGEEEEEREGVGDFPYETCPQFASSPLRNSASAETSSPGAVGPRKRLQDPVEVEQPLRKRSSQEPTGKLSSGGSSLASEPATTRTSPEVVDSGYPNSQDLTPEGEEGSSIGMGSDSEPMSPGRAGAGVGAGAGAGFFEAAAGLVENGDLANNNRDKEGNNVIARGEEPEREQGRREDLQPLLDDLENENDVYVVLQNGFPAWLLRIGNPGGGGGEEVGPPAGGMEPGLDRAAG